jgi:two-component system chemotaxis sensor kinase CheA
MNALYDISEDELPIFLAETDDQIQVLDQGMVELEKEQGNPTLLQAIFRAAHTLKGTSGMVGHKRMVEITHALENALDGLRKGNLDVSIELVDLCLDAIDAIKWLREEVVSNQVSQVDIQPIIERFEALSRSKGTVKPPEHETSTSPRNLPSAKEEGICITASISPESIASAARAFQVYMVLQDSGQILNMIPGQEQIETAAPVQTLTAQLIPSKSLEEIKNALLSISEITQLAFGCEEISIVAQETTPAAPKDTPARTAEAVSKERVPTKSGEKTIRTSVERLDSLMNLVGELITDRNRLYLIRGELDAATKTNNHVEMLEETIIHVGRITDQLQAEVMGIRMLPIANVFNKFPRLVRDLARKAGKQIDLSIRGEDTELDRSVIEEISDPLIHLLRNAVDHGVESPEERRAAGKPDSGSVLLSAKYEEGRIILTVQDDGRGIATDRLKAKVVEKGLMSEKEAAGLSEEEAIDLIFIPGLSTAQTVSDISGRGVGMDIVRTNIEHLNGNIQVESWPGRGTQFQIILPLTLAILPSLLVRVGNGTFAVPLTTVIETIRVPVSDIQTINGRPVISLRNQVLPIAWLKSLFGIQSNGDHRRQEYIVIVQSGKNRIGLVVDTLIGEQEVVVKSLSALVGEIAGISSAAILGDGQVALIIDVHSLFKLAGTLNQNYRRWDLLHTVKEGRNVQIS